MQSFEGKQSKNMKAKREFHYMFESDTLGIGWVHFQVKVSIKCKRHRVRVSLSKPKTCSVSSLHFDKGCPSPAALQPPPPSSGTMEVTCDLLGSATRGIQMETGGW